MLHGRHLYSEIFFNHQPLGAYLSLIVQSFTHPVNLYEFLLRHRQFLMLFSFVFNVGIIWRFRLAGALFVGLYELTKYYMFGDRFLSESFIVYPLVYMAGLLFFKLEKGKILDIEIIAIGLFSWFIVFNREPYAPLALVIYALLIGIPRTRVKKFSLILFISLSVITILIQPLKMYFYNVFTLNYFAFFAPSAELNTHPNLLEIIFFPLFVFFKGPMNEFKIILMGLSLSYILATLYFIYLKKYKLVLITLLLLALANVRVQEPGTTFYAAFHQIQWFGIISISTFLMIDEMRKRAPKMAILASLPIIIAFLVYLVQPTNFLRAHVNQQYEFATNFSETYDIGQAVKALSKPDQTFFIDHGDSLNLAYWIAGLKPAYKYSWYTYVAINTKHFSDARTEMFKDYPPDFYLGGPNLYIEANYVKLKNPDKHDSIWVKKSILGGISEKQWQKSSEVLYSKP